MKWTILLCLIFGALCENKTGFEKVQESVKTFLIAAKIDNVPQDFYIKDDRGQIIKDRSQIVKKLGDLKETLDLETAQLKWFNYTNDNVLYTDVEYELKKKVRFWVPKYVFHLQDSVEGEVFKSLEVVREDIAKTEKKYFFESLQNVVRIALLSARYNYTEMLFQHLHEDFYIEKDGLKITAQITEEISDLADLIDLKSAWLKNWKTSENRTAQNTKIEYFSMDRLQKYEISIENWPIDGVLRSLKVEKSGMSQGEMVEYLEARTKIVENLLDATKAADLTNVLNILHNDFYVLDRNEIVYLEHANQFGPWVFKVGERIDLTSARLRYWDRTDDGHFRGDIEYGLIKNDRPMKNKVVFQLEDNFEKSRVTFLQLLRD